MKRTVILLAGMALVLPLLVSHPALAGMVQPSLKTSVGANVGLRTDVANAPHLGLVKILVLLKTPGRLTVTRHFRLGQTAHSILAWTMSLDKNAKLPKVSARLRVAKAGKPLYSRTMTGKVRRNGGTFTKDLRLNTAGTLAFIFTLKVAALTVTKSSVVTVTPR